MEQDGFLFLSHCCDNSLHLNSVSEHEINILFIILIIYLEVASAL